MSNFSVACGAHIITLWVSSDIGGEAVPRALLRIRCVYVLGDDSQLSVQCQYSAGTVLCGHVMHQSVYSTNRLELRSSVKIVPPWGPEHGVVIDRPHQYFWLSSSYYRGSPSDSDPIPASSMSSVSDSSMPVVMSTHGSYYCSDKQILFSDIA